ncbi:BA3454 family stress response protein [Neobacillus pocheonensis]
MMEITVTVRFQGKNYLTNVIADKEVSEQEILRLAEKQVRKQWAK